MVWEFLLELGFKLPDWAAVGVLGTVFFAPFLTYCIAARKAKTNHVVSLLMREASYSDRLANRIIALEDTVKECEDRHSRCESRVKGLEDRLDKKEGSEAALAGALREALVKLKVLERNSHESHENG